MSTIASFIQAAARGIQPLLAYEPAVRPDFSGADHTTTAAIIAAVLRKGVNTAPAIISYLMKRGCRHDAATIHFLLDAYEGGDRRHCVWRRNKAGRYFLLR